MKSKFIGALIGTAVGDASGAPLEGYSMDEVNSVCGGSDEVNSMCGGSDTWEMISGRYTDDTEMMIGVAESLIENKGFNGEDMALRFTENYDPSRGYGPGSKEALRRITEGESWEEASKTLFRGKGSYGNGQKRCSVVKARTEMELQCVSHLSAFFIMMMPISCEK
jgi:poly(ADP-ribose) glycohydrolase ARH3